jgi:hypothetical protein
MVYAMPHRTSPRDPIEWLLMPRHPRRTIQVISHGPSCLDGVMAAAAIRRFYPQDRVMTTLAANGDADRVIPSVRSRNAGGAEAT